MSSRLLTVAAAAAACALSSVTPAASAAPLAPHPAAFVAPSAPKAAAQGGFVPVLELPALPTGGVAPAQDELWLVGKDPVTKVYLAGHFHHGEWDIMTPPGTPYDNPNDRPTMAASGPTNVWLSTHTSLSRWDGEAWHVVELPKLTAPEVGAIAVKDAHTTYVALASTDTRSPVTGGRFRLYELKDGVWSDLGDGANAGAVEQIAVTDKGLSVLQSGIMVWQTRDLVDGSWGPTQLVAQMKYRDTTFGGYFVEKDGSHLLLGGTGVNGLDPMCQSWTPPAAPAPCRTTQVTGFGNLHYPMAPAVAQVKGGYVLGGRDYTTPAGFMNNNPTHRVEGAFALRQADGTEVPLAGDAADHTQLMLADPDGRGAWAVTVDPANCIVLQRWDGHV